jgi:DNA-binding CsgD family transcriptional regulator
MNKEEFSLTMIVWRIAPLVIALIWIASYVFQFYPIGTYSYEYMIITPTHLYIPVILFGIMIFLTMLFPHKFYIHGAFCWFFGLLWLIDGGLIISLSIHLFGYVFFYRQGFFNKDKKKKLLAGGLVIAAAITSQLRFTDVDMLSRGFNFAGFILVIIFTIVILRPEIQTIRKKRRKKILVLQSDLFTKKDVVILRKILIGIKYEVIAKEEQLALSTLKKQVRQIFNELNVSDRTHFLVLYANHEIILNENNTHEHTK